MSIEVACKNGHRLKIKDEYAGKKGLCPKCGVPIAVPVPALSEDALVDLLGQMPAVDDEPEVHQDRKTGSSSGSSSSSSMSLLGGQSMVARTHKVCPACKKEVSQGYHVCPHCHMYFADNTEVHRRMSWMCKHCGQAVGAKDRICPKCHKVLN